MKKVGIEKVIGVKIDASAEEIYNEAPGTNREDNNGGEDDDVFTAIRTQEALMFIKTRRNCL